jgi:anti-sigma factor RsiW
MSTEPTPAPAPLSEDEIHALVDGCLDDAQRHAIEARLARDPVANATRMAWQQQRDALRGLHRDILDETIPPSLASAARQAGAARLAIGSWARWGGMAAGVVCAFGLGWMMRGQVAAPESATVAVKVLPAPGSGVREFVRQASVAHAVFAPEVRHPVEVPGAQQEHLVQWLSKRLGKPLKVPDLAAEGYELVGGRLLPGTDGARAQFMFQDKAGERITLYIGAMKTTPASALVTDKTGQSSMAKAADPRETVFSFSDDGPVPGFYWVDQGFGYAIAGKLSREQLMQLAKAVYKQL